MSGFNSPSATNLLSSAGNDTIAPDVDSGDLEAGRGANGGNKASTAAGNQLGAPPSGIQNGSVAQGQMNAPQREQSIWEQSACVIDICPCYIYIYTRAADALPLNVSVAIQSRYSFFSSSDPSPLLSICYVASSAVHVRPKTRLMQASHC